MQVAHTVGAGFLMQTVDILGNNQTGVITQFEIRNVVMGGIGRGIANNWPANQAAPPISLAGFMVVHKILMLNRLLAFPGAFSIAVIGNARIRANTRTGQNRRVWDNGE